MSSNANPWGTPEDTLSFAYEVKFAVGLVGRETLLVKFAVTHCFLFVS